MTFREKLLQGKNFNPCHPRARKRFKVHPLDHMIPAVLFFFPFFVSFLTASSYYYTNNFSVVIQVRWKIGLVQLHCRVTYGYKILHMARQRSCQFFTIYSLYWTAQKIGIFHSITWALNHCRFHATACAPGCTRNTCVNSGQFHMCNQDNAPDCRVPVVSKLGWHMNEMKQK